MAGVSGNSYIDSSFSFESLEPFVHLAIRIQNRTSEERVTDRVRNVLLANGIEFSLKDDFEKRVKFSKKKLRKLSDGNGVEEGCERFISGAMNWRSAARFRDILNQHCSQNSKNSNIWTITRLSKDPEDMRVITVSQKDFDAIHWETVVASLIAAQTLATSTSSTSSTDAPVALESAAPSTSPTPDESKEVKP